MCGFFNKLLLKILNPIELRTETNNGITTKTIEMPLGNLKETKQKLLKGEYWNYKILNYTTGPESYTFKLIRISNDKQVYY